MRLENSFTVAAPLDRTWRTLLDIERVATCLPGAKIESADQAGVYRGAVKIKLGPMTMDYRGTARLEDVDEDTHTASIAVQAREAKGQGTAAAVIRNSLEAQDGRTKVVAVTDLNVTGRQAQFGRGIMEDVAGTMMSQFAERLEQELREPEPGEPEEAVSEQAPAAEPAAAPGVEGEGAEALDVGGLLAKTPAIRYAAIAAALLALIALLALLNGRRRQLTFNVNLRR